MPSDAIHKTEVLECTCQRCGYTWRPRRPWTPAVCARCKSRLWMVPRDPPSHNERSDAVPNERSDKEGGG